jgi:hypothetical protein
MFGQLLCGSCNQIHVDEFLVCIFHYGPLKSFVETFTPNIYIHIFEEQCRNRSRRKLADFEKEKKEFKYEKNLAEVSFIKDLTDRMRINIKNMKSSGCQCQFMYLSGN